MLAALALPYASTYTFGSGVFYGIILSAVSSKYDSFTVGAIAAYVLARLCEIKNVRIILSGKRNLVSDDVLVERVRMTYV